MWSIADRLNLSRTNLSAELHGSENWLPFSGADHDPKEEPCENEVIRTDALWVHPDAWLHISEIQR